MKGKFPRTRFNEENAQKAFRAIAAHQDFDIIRWALLTRYAEDRKLVSMTDANAINRGIGKVEEIEWVLEQFGEPLYGGLPLADESLVDETALTDIVANAKIGGGYLGGSDSRPPL